CDACWPRSKVWPTNWSLPIAEARTAPRLLPGKPGRAFSGGPGPITPIKRISPRRTRRTIGSCPWMQMRNPLHTALLDWKSRESEKNVYEMARRTWYLGAWVRHSGWCPDFQRRLYRRDAARFSGIIHESLRFEGEPGRLHGDLLHYTVRSFAEHEQKVERYTTLAAQQMYEAGRRHWRAAICFATPWSWLQNFVFR